MEGVAEGGGGGGRERLPLAFFLPYLKYILMGERDRDRQRQTETEREVE